MARKKPQSEFYGEIVATFEIPYKKKVHTSETQIIEAIIASWHHVIKKDELQTLVRLMKRRCVVVIKNRGYSTKY